MSYLNMYRIKMTASGNSPSESILNNTKHTVENNFNNSLFSGLVLIDGVEYDAIITQEKKSEDKKLLLKPDTFISVGAVVKINELKYLILDFLRDGINEIYPTATLKLCNSSILLKSETVRVPVLDENGNQVYDEFGDPMSEEIEGDPTTLPCITKTTVTVDSTDEAINLPEGRLDAVIQYTEHDDIQIGKEFTMYGSKYQIIGIDYTKSLNKTGILTIQGKKV